jgi:transmembrane sensor
LREKAESAAAVWLASFDAGLSPEKRRQFEHWLSADPLNADAWSDLKGAWAVFDGPRISGDAPAMVRELAARRRRRQWTVRLGACTTAVAAAAAAWAFFAARPALPSAGIGIVASNAVILKPESRVLPDGSVVELNKGARIEVNYQPAARNVRLVSGEAHFTVAKNHEWPFIVTVGGVEVRAVGTAFALKLGSENVDLLVTEGRVAVNRPAPDSVPDRSASATPGGSAQPLLVSAGGLLVVSTGTHGPDYVPHIQTLTTEEIDRRLAWREPAIGLSDTPLADALALFNQGGRLHLSIADPQLARLRLSGVFRASNAEGFVRLLESNYGVRVERTGGGEVVLRGAH